MKTPKQARWIMPALCILLSLAVPKAEAQCKYPATSDPFSITGFRTEYAGQNLVRFIPLCGSGDCLTGDLAGYNFLWSFGDGTYSFSSLPSKAYASKSPTGGYEVALKVSNIYEEPDFVSEAPPHLVGNCDLAGPKVTILRDSLPGKPDEALCLSSHQPVAKVGYILQYKVDFVNAKKDIAYFQGEFIPDTRLSLSQNGNSLGFVYDPAVILSVTVERSGNQDVVKFTGKVGDRKTGSLVINTLLDPKADPKGRAVESIASVTYGPNPPGGGSASSVHHSAPIGENWDPNEIMAVPLKYVIPGEWIEYTITYENKGDAMAERVIIIDPLPFELDASSFKMVNSSHPDELRDPLIMGNTIMWVMPSLNLPGVDSKPQGPRSGKEKNTPKNTGYITFRVQTRADLPLLTSIPNKAWVTFDDALPEGTNTCLNVIPETVYQLTEEKQPNAIGVSTNK